MTEWRQRLPRIHHLTQKLLALRNAVITFSLPDSIFPSHITVQRSWLQTWKASEISNRTLDKVSTKELYQQATTHVAAPRVIRQWSDLHLPTAVTHISPTWFKPVWRMSLPRKWLDVLYAVLNNALPTSVKVTRSLNPTSCPRCHVGPDDIPHILFQCQVSDQLWRWAQSVYVFWLPHARMPPQALDFKTWLCITLESSHMTHRWKWFFWCIPVLRNLWLCRNDSVFNNVTWTLPQLQQHCIQDWLYAATVMAKHYPPAEFFPLFSFHFDTHSVQWRFTSPAVVTAAVTATVVPASLPPAAGS